MINLPLTTYSGVTFILSELGRHDRPDRLIGGRSGEYWEQCLQLAQTSRFNVCIKTIDDNTPYLPGTKVVVTLGSKAQRLITPNLTLNEARGYCYKKGSEIYVSTYAPQDAFDRKQYYDPTQEGDDDDGEDDDIEAGKEKDHSPTRRKNWKFWMSKDIQKAFSIARDGFNPKLISTEYRTYEPSQVIINLLESYKNENIFFDIETNPNFNVTVFSFSRDYKTIYTVPFLRWNGELAYGDIELCKILQALAICFSRNNIVIHNCLFDLLILCWRYKIPPPPTWKQTIDTMVLQHRLSPETEKSLGHCGSLYTHEEYHKNENIFVPKNPQQELQLWRYNAKDVALLSLIYTELEKEIQRKGIRDSINRAQKLLLPYLLQSLQGIRVDLEFKDKNFQDLEKLKIQYQRIAKILVGYDIEKLGSWQRISKYLYEYKGIPKPNQKWKDGKLVYEELTSSGTLYKLRTKYNIPFIDLVLKYRHIGKQAGFLKFNCWTPLNDQWLYKSNPSRFTSADSITGTDTLRNSSRMLFDFWGSNKQNVEKKLRRVGIPDEGKEFVQTDQSGAEAKILAYIAPKGKYRQLLELNIKLYNFVAMHLFQKEWEKCLGRSIKEYIDAPIADLPKMEGFKELNALIKSSDDWVASRRFYYICKMVVLASGYGMRGPTFQKNIMKKSEGSVIISAQQATYYLDFFHNLFPEVRIWQMLTLNKLKENGMVLENLFGDKREFYGLWDDTLFKQAYAFVPQSTVGMLTNIAISELQEMIDRNDEEIKDMGVDILSNQHDAVLSQVRIGCGEHLAKVQERLLGKTFFKGQDNEFVMKSESQIGRNWSFK